MTKIFVFKRRQMALLTVIILAAIAVVYWFSNSDQVIPVFGNSVKDVRVYDVAAIEVKTTLADGTESNTYQWFPDTIHVAKGDHVEIRFHGIHGESHPFIIEGKQIMEEVVKGEETVVQFHASERGTFHLICLTHYNDQENGPMVAQIVVE